MSINEQAPDTELRRNSSDSTVPLSQVSDPVRLKDLRSSGLLDTPPDHSFDRLTILACRITRSPVSLVSLVDSDRQFFKSSQGLPEPWATRRETPLSHSFCQHVVAQDAPLVIEDAHKDALVCDNLAVHDLGVVAYLGVPLRSPSGQVLGSFCVIDTRPRRWSADDVEVVSMLGECAGAELRLLYQVRELEEAHILISQANQFLRKSEERLRLVLDGANDSFWDWNIPTGEVQFSPRWAEIIGCRSEEVEPHLSSRDRLVHPDDTPQVAKVLQDHLNGLTEEYEAEYRLKCRSGDWKWILDRGKVVELDAEGRPLRMAGTHTDISRRRQAETALRENQEQLAGVFTAAMDAIIAIDEAERIQLFNTAAEKMFRVPAADTIGKPLQLFVPEWRTLVQPDSSEDSAQSTPALPRLCRPTAVNGLRANGEQFPIEMTLSQSRVSGKTLRTAVVRDVTERRQIERLKDEFLSLVSHELKTPLTSIRGALGLLASDTLKKQPESAQRMFAIALSNTERLIRIVSDILDLERMEAGRMVMQTQACDAGALLAKAAETLEVDATDAGVTVFVSPVQFELMADPDRIIQTLVNLLGNAIKFSQPGGRVWISADRSGSEALFHVKDEGRGIPPDKLDIIFERFAQVDASDSRGRGGSGLGLAICRAIIREHGGRIWAESALGKGSSFWFTLPLRQNGASSTSVERPEAGAPGVCQPEAG